MRGISRRLLLPQERDVTFLSLVLFWMTTKVPTNDADAQWTYHSHGCSKITIFQKKYLFDSTYFKVRYFKEKITLAECLPKQIAFYILITMIYIYTKRKKIQQNRASIWIGSSHNCVRYLFFLKNIVPIFYPF